MLDVLGHLPTAPTAPTSPTPPIAYASYTSYSLHPLHLLYLLPHTQAKKVHFLVKVSIGDRAGTFQVHDRHPASPPWRRVQ